MTSTPEHLCAECEHCYPINDVQCTGDGTYRCDWCHDRLELDHLVKERQPQSDDTLTLPLGDPREACHNGSTAGGNGRGSGVRRDEYGIEVHS